ncbi:alginate lyase family protein [Chitinophaga sp. Cy-1792]|uniref:alginate lyase family protein n=1 Tax=Chitinophaga sp. Cy-1792 TaxID=2608339 RepID=UPI00141F03A5|nr:alginate lyase family protein [Chitinophaga sp. Cy-1792]NIG55911.1 hypothetical protein [Chitinophaga sp. Cy-1792]
MKHIQRGLYITILFLAAICRASGQTAPFIHPGLLHSMADLERMEAAVITKRSPIYEGFEVFKSSPFSADSYTQQGPMTMVGRNPTVGQSTYDSDANAAYQHALMWAITGDQHYAEKAVQIIDSWADSLQAITGRDAVLMAGLGPFKMINAAEILRYTYPAWPKSAISKAEQHFLKVVYPVVAEFAPFANGNWDDAALKTVMAIGIFCNNSEIFEKAVRYYVNGWGNGSLTNYIVNEAGQVQETGRDQAHTQLGLGMLAECCEMAWHQGLDLYGYADNRLLKGFEYTAKYNLGYNDIAYTPMLDRTGKYAHMRPSEQARGNLRAVYEQVYNHYVHRAGMAAPYVSEAAAKLRPEGPGMPGADHPGYGTLFYSISEKQQLSQEIGRSRPAGLILTTAKAITQLSWVPLAGINEYTVRRGLRQQGPWQSMGIAHGNTFTDSTAKPGTLYYYTVSGRSKGMESAVSLPASMVGGGLPTGWHNCDIGAVKQPGKALSDGAMFRIEAAGVFNDSIANGFNYTYKNITGAGEMVIQVCPQPGSQFTAVGLMLRQDLQPGSPYAAWVLYPAKTKEIEAPRWSVQMRQKGMAPAATLPLQAPAVTYGRLTGSYWLKIKYRLGQITGSGSYDGKTWEQLASAEWMAGKPMLLGIVVASNIANTTIVRVCP